MTLATADLQPSSQLRVLALMAGTVASDGTVSDPERELVHTWAGRLSVSRDRADELLAQAAAGSLELRLGKSEAERVVALEAVIEAALVDGVVGDKERQLLVSVGRRAGFDPTEVSKRLCQARSARAGTASGRRPPPEPPGPPESPESRVAGSSSAQPPAGEAPQEAAGDALVPPNLDALFARVLATDSADRPAAAEALKGLLARWLHEHGGSETPGEAPPELGGAVSRWPGSTRDAPDDTGPRTSSGRARRAPAGGSPGPSSRRARPASGRRLRAGASERFGRRVGQRLDKCAPGPGERRPEAPAEEGGGPPRRPPFFARVPGWLIPSLVGLGCLGLIAVAAAVLIRTELPQTDATLAGDFNLAIARLNLALSAPGSLELEEVAALREQLESVQERGLRGEHPRDHALARDARRALMKPEFAAAWSRALQRRRVVLEEQFEELLQVDAWSRARALLAKQPELFRAAEHVWLADARETLAAAEQYSQRVRRFLATGRSGLSALRQAHRIYESVGSAHMTPAYDELTKWFPTQRLYADALYAQTIASVRAGHTRAARRDYDILRLVERDFHRFLARKDPQESSSLLIVDADLRRYLQAVAAAVLHRLEEALRQQRRRR